MNFKKATDELLASVTLTDLADALGVSTQAVRQARAAEASTAYRSAPEGWERGVVKLASRQASRMASLARRLGS